MANKTLENAGALEHVIVIGSWAEYLYSKCNVLENYTATLRTLDTDFLVRNMRRPANRINLLSITPMAIYAEVEFTIIDQDKYGALNNEFLFEFTDENGERLPNSASGAGGGIIPVDNSGLCFVQQGSFRSVSYMPDTVILRGFNYVTKERYESHTFEMMGFPDR